MEALIWIGGGISAAGLLGLIWSIIRVVSARKKGLTDEGLRDVVQKVLPYNMAALGLSILGLMLVMVGLMLS